jgi:hypothetical protein
VGEDSVLNVEFLAELESSGIVGLCEIEGVGGVIYATDFVVAFSSLHTVLAFVPLQQGETVGKVLNRLLQMALQLIRQAHVFQQRYALYAIFPLLFFHNLEAFLEIFEAQRIVSLIEGFLSDDDVGVYVVLGVSFSFFGFDTNHFGLVFHVLGCVVELLVHSSDAVDEIKVARLILTVYSLLYHQAVLVVDEGFLVFLDKLIALPYLLQSVSKLIVKLA